MYISNYKKIAYKWKWQARAIKLERLAYKIGAISLLVLIVVFCLMKMQAGRIQASQNNYISMGCNGSELQVGDVVGGVYKCDWLF